MEMRTGSVNFPQARSLGPRTATQTFIFPRDVDQAVAGLVGYSAAYAGGDKYLGMLEIQVNTQINRNVVIVTATYGLRDWSGSWDDDYEGTVQFAVLADLISATQAPGPAPRADLVITDLEITQATQHFRSAQHLDGPNVRPDNSIRLIAHKNTGVRTYVDYDATSGLPSITKLSGSLEVTTGSTTFTLEEEMQISPRRDNQIDRGSKDHTLNFVIPDGWCQGELTLRCYVFDKTAHDQRSAVFQRTIRFESVAPLRVYGVGVHYTGQGKDLAAPSRAQVLQTFTFAEKTFPVGEVLITGYSTIDYAVDMKANINDGCGNGFNTLLDRVRDMRGSSDDVYYGVLPGGIDSGTVGGCGGGGVGAGFIGNGPTAAQEIGHAFGLNHAPCDDADRCQNPSNQDGNYPKYGSFPSDSIGEFGYDPASNVVFKPASVFDFMGYSGPNWVSPYTYTRLMSHFPITSGLSPISLRISATALETESRLREEHPEWIRKTMPMLFLRLSINRDRHVVREPSFHFPALQTRSVGDPSGFVVELLDKDSNVLSCQPLYEECKQCSFDCWPKTFRDVIPFYAEATKLVVWEGKDKVYEENIPAPPLVKVNCKYLEGEGEFEVKWSATDAGEEDTDLWYLVQWQDGDAWRGVAPRTKAASMRISPNLMGGWLEIPIRVLATSGIATGVGTCTLTIRLQLKNQEIVTMGQVATLGEGLVIPSILQVGVMTEDGRSVPDPNLAWYDDKGSEIGRGRSLDLRTLHEGQSIVKAVVLGRGRESAERTWLVERRDDSSFILRAEFSKRPTARLAR